MIQPTLKTKDADGVDRVIFTQNENGQKHGSDSQSVVMAIDQPSIPTVEIETPGGNIWPICLNDAILDVGNSRVEDYGPGPIPGTYSTEFTLITGNNGVNTGDIPLSGRTDGALVGLSVWMKGSGTVEIICTALGAYSGERETVFSRVVNVPSVWTEISVKDFIFQFDCTHLFAAIRAYGADCTLEMCCADFRILHDGDVWPEYQTSKGEIRPVIITKRLTTSYSAYGDSFIGGSAGGQFHPELQRLLLGCKYYNGGVGGQTSTQIKNRFIASDAATKIRRAAGVIILEGGNNNIADPTTWLADIDTMVSYVPHGRFLIMSQLTGYNDHTQGDYQYVQDGRRILKSRFGIRYVDNDMELRAGGESNLAAYRYDNAHPNLCGCGIIAESFYRAMRRNGFLPLSHGGSDWGENEDQEMTHQCVFQTKIDATTDPTTLLLPLRKRYGFIIANNSLTETLYVNFVGYTTTVYWIAKIPPGQSREWIGTKYHGAVGGYWSAASGNAVITEII